MRGFGLAYLCCPSALWLDQWMTVVFHLQFCSIDRVPVTFDFGPLQTDVHSERLSTPK